MKATISVMVEREFSRQLFDVFLYYAILSLSLSFFPLLRLLYITVHLSEYIENNKSIIIILIVYRISNI